MATLGNTTITNLNSGTIRIQPILGSYQEGIRIQPYSAWSTIMLLGTDSTASTSGTSAKSWGIFNNDGNFYINRNGSSNQQSSRLWGHNNGFTIGNTNLSSYALNTASFICGSWIRTKGATGWYNEDYGGGWYMTDANAIRNYNSKAVALDNNLSVGGLTTVSSESTHKGIKVGNTYINALGDNLIFQNNSNIRFGGDSWDYDIWAGLKYVHSNKTIHLGIADGSIFSANTAQSGGTVNFPGVSTLSITSGGRIHASGGNLYLGNSNNAGWLMVQDICSQSGNTYWHIYNGGAARFGQITSTVADGTAPFVVSSTTKVANLNADYLDGYTRSAYAYNMDSANYDCNEVGTHFAAYRFAGTPTNVFDGGAWSNMLVIGAGSDTCTQIGCPYNSDNLYFRRGTWYSDGTGSIRSNAWKTIIHSDNYTSYAATSTHKHTFTGSSVTTSSNNGHTPAGTVSLSGSLSSGTLTITASFAGSAVAAHTHTVTAAGTISTPTT